MNARTEICPECGAKVFAQGPAAMTRLGHAANLFRSNRNGKWVAERHPANGQAACGDTAEEALAHLDRIIEPDYGF